MLEVSGESPKVQAYVIGSPLGSDELTPKKLHVRALQLGALNAAVGATLDAGSAIVTVRVALADLPQPSVTVSVAV